MVGIKDFGMPSCCMNCEMFDGEYGNCDIIGDTQDFEYQWNENRPFDCPLVETIPKDQYEARLKENNELINDLEELRTMINKFAESYETRLKADLVAMLTEIQLEIEELDTPNNNCAYLDCADIIQQKIDKLKEAD